MCAYQYSIWRMRRRKRKRSAQMDTVKNMNRENKIKCTGTPRFQKKPPTLEHIPHTKFGVRVPVRRCLLRSVCRRIYIQCIVLYVRTWSAGGSEGRQQVWVHRRIPRLGYCVRRVRLHQRKEDCKRWVYPLLPLGNVVDCFSDVVVVLGLVGVLAVPDINNQITSGRTVRA